MRYFLHGENYRYRGRDRWDEYTDVLTDLGLQWNLDKDSPDIPRNKRVIFRIDFTASEKEKDEFLSKLRMKLSK